MSLKDEINNRIRAERKKLEKEDKIKEEKSRNKEAFKERQRIRFQPLRNLLDELVASFGRRYIETKIWDGDEYMGYEVEGYYIAVGVYPFNLVEEFAIEPGFSFEDYKDESLPIETGFVVSKFETDYNSGSEEKDFQTKNLFNQGRQKHEFLTEKEVINYLTEEIAPAIALLQHHLGQSKYNFLDSLKEFPLASLLGRWCGRGLRRIKGLFKNLKSKEGS